MIVAGRGMTISDAAREGRKRTLEASITDCIRRWAVTHPTELALLDRQVRIERQHLFNKTGISADGHALKKAEVPVTLHHAMRREIHPEWLWIKEIRNLFFSIFKVGCINRTSETSDKWHNRTE